MKRMTENGLVLFQAVFGLMWAVAAVWWFFAMYAIAEPSSSFWVVGFVIRLVVVPLIISIGSLSLLAAKRRGATISFITLLSSLILAVQSVAWSVSALRSSSNAKATSVRASLLVTAFALLSVAAGQVLHRAAGRVPQGATQ